jgi:hypothetical protein
MIADCLHGIQYAEFLEGTTPFWWRMYPLMFIRECVSAQEHPYLFFTFFYILLI